MKTEGYKYVTQFKVTPGEQWLLTCMTLYFTNGMGNWTLKDGQDHLLWSFHQLEHEGMQEVTFTLPFKLSYGETLTVQNSEGSTESAIRLDIAKMSNIHNPPSQQKDSDYTWQEPQIKCPKCQSIINGISSAQETVSVGTPVNTAVGAKKTMFNQKVTTPPNSQTVGALRMIWRVGPCQCQVSDKYAGNYTAEINRRKDGKTPQKVTEHGSAALAEKIEKTWDKIIGCIEILNEASKKVFHVSNIIPTEKQLIRHVDSLAKYDINEVAKLPVCKLSQVALGWAKKNNLVPPPQAEEYKILPVETIAELISEAGMDIVDPVVAAQVNATTAMQQPPSSNVTLQTLPEGEPPNYQKMQKDNAEKITEFMGVPKAKLKPGGAIPPITKAKTEAFDKFTDYADSYLKQATENAAKDTAKKIQQSIATNQATGAPLSPEATQFLHKLDQDKKSKNNPFIKPPVQVDGPKTETETRSDWVKKRSKRKARKLNAPKRNKKSS
jgi:hypothetical protein